AGHHRPVARACAGGTQRWTLSVDAGGKSGLGAWGRGGAGGGRSGRGGTPGDPYSPAYPRCDGHWGGRGHLSRTALSDAPRRGWAVAGATGAAGGDLADDLGRGGGPATGPGARVLSHGRTTADQSPGDRGDTRPVTPGQSGAEMFPG